MLLKSEFEQFLLFNLIVPRLREGKNALCFLAEFKKVGDTYGRTGIDEGERMHSVAGITFGMAHVCMMHLDYDAGMKSVPI